MPYTQAQVDEAKQNLVDRKGVVSVTFADQSITFASYEDAMTWIASMQREVDATGTTPKTHRFAVTSKGV